MLAFFNFKKKNLVLKFHYDMTYCVDINFKEGDFWIHLSNCVLSLMLHKCHTSHLLALTKLNWFARRFTMSTKCSQTSPCTNSCY